MFADTFPVSVFPPPAIVIPVPKIEQFPVMFAPSVYVPAKYKLPQLVIVDGNNGNAPPT